MTIEQESTRIHWNHFLALEEDLFKVSRFIDINTDNFNCYSIELSRILMAASSEVDVVAKLLCKMLDLSSKSYNIYHYKNVIGNNLPGFFDSIVEVPRWSITLSPWSNWNYGKSPDWWTSNNKVKHQRDKFFSHADLKNALNSVAALFIILLHFYRVDAENGDLKPNSRLFIPISPIKYDIQKWGHNPGFVYIFSDKYH